MALKSDGTVVIWGNSEVHNPIEGLTGVFAIGGGISYGLAVRTGPPLPVITTVPVNQHEVAGGSVTFTSLGKGVAAVQYQWQFNGVNIS
ncbi:MAG: immunoglobulin domain-containing protein [Limisphaerales bacterium]